MTSDNTIDNKEPKHKDLLVEYQTAQDSAQQHDNLVWSVTSIMWGASLILIGFILDKLDETSLRPILLLVSVLGLFINLVVWVFALQFTLIKR